MVSILFKIMKNELIPLILIGWKFKNSRFKDEPYVLNYHTFELMEKQRLKR